MRTTTMLVVAATGLCWLARAEPPVGHFVVNTGTGAGTVTDTETGLAWQQVVLTADLSQADGTLYCSNLILDGGGWRLPTVVELQTIVDEGRTNPAVDPVAFPNTPALRFWTSTRLSGSPSYAWLVDFDEGWIQWNDATVLRRVRCVR